MMISKCLANFDTVSEPVALELRQKSGNIYLHAQIFVGLMYTAAGLCMWFLRIWKIKQIELMAASQMKRSEDTDAASTEMVDDNIITSTGRSQSSALRRIYMWKKV